MQRDAVWVTAWPYGDARGTVVSDDERGGGETCRQATAGPATTIGTRAVPIDLPQVTDPLPPAATLAVSTGTDSRRTRHAFATAADPRLPVARQRRGRKARTVSARRRGMLRQTCSRSPTCWSARTSQTPAALRRFTSCCAMAVTARSTTPRSTNRNFARPCTTRASRYASGTSIDPNSLHDIDSQCRTRLRVGTRSGRERGLDMRGRLLIGLAVGVASLAMAAAASAAPPTNTTPPQISGHSPPQVGDVLTEVPGVWTGAPTAIQVQWVRCTLTPSMRRHSRRDQQHLHGHAS